MDDRYPHRAAFGTVCGGAGSPIFADGRIYLFHYRPAGEPQPQKLAAALGRFEKENQREPSPVERDALADYARAQADTIVVCLDACTGGVVWRATFPQLSGNYQTHKWRGFNPTATLCGPALSRRRTPPANPTMTVPTAATTRDTLPTISSRFFIAFPYSPKSSLMFPVSFMIQTPAGC